MAKAKEPKFEEAIEQLSRIIEDIESGQTGLEESLAQYEKGMKLIAQCRTILEAAERRMAELSVDTKGKLQVKDDEQPHAD